MRVQVVDPPAYTPPYDRALCAALAARRRRGRADHQPLPVRPGPRAPTATGSTSSSTAAPPRRGARRARAARGCEARRARARDVRGCAARSRDADVVHLQWLTRARARRRAAAAAARACSPSTTRSPPSGRGSPAGAPRLRRMDAADRALRARRRRRCASGSGSTATRVHVIPHGAFDYLTRLADERPLADELAGGRGAGRPLLRPDPPLQGHRRPARGVSRDRGRRALDRRPAR